jgi:hypothetical protein
MKSAIWFSLAFVLTVCGTAHAGPINLVTNGSFEQGLLGIGSFQGWTTNLGDISTFVDSSGVTGPNYGQASDGLWAAYFGSTLFDGGSSISQTLATTPNQLYVLTFDLANDNGGVPPSNSFVAFIDGSPVLSFANLPDEGFAHEQFSFIATGPATTLEFSAFNDQSYAELDNVVVSAATSPVPEPSSLALFITGALLFACVAWAARPAEPRFV